MAYIANRSGIADYMQPVVVGTDITDYERCVGLWVGTGGNINATFIGGEQTTIMGVTGGSPIPARVRQVRAGTTAGQILAMMVSQ